MRNKHLKSSSSPIENSLIGIIYGMVIMVLLWLAGGSFWDAAQQTTESDGIFLAYMGTLLAMIATIMLTAVDNANTPERTDAAILGGIFGLLLHLAALAFGFASLPTAVLLSIGLVMLLSFVLSDYHDSFAPNIPGEAGATLSARQLEAWTAENRHLALTITNLIGVVAMAVALITGMRASLSVGNPVIILAVFFTSLVVIAGSIYALKQRSRRHEMRYPKHVFK